MPDEITRAAIERLRISEREKQNLLSGEVAVQYFGAPRMGPTPWKSPGKGGRLATSHK